ncbi:perforin-1-like [Xyrichtys novacula]|uniref:Perforin-1-like n=1 Tax=Xyrichtys novacula TaxID=13765 RepID=A0AAV1G636_XYRNO|nr:perforin-1-like [Xyrichtys novacula]
MCDIYSSSRLRDKKHTSKNSACCAVMASSLSLFLLVLSGLTVAQSDVRIFDLRATGLPSDIFGTTDGYVVVYCGSASLGKTVVRRDTVNPWWEEEFSHFQAQEGDVLRLEVHDSDLIFDDLLGICQRNIRPGTHHHDCYLEEGGTLHYSYTLSQ